MTNAIFECFTVDTNTCAGPQVSGSHRNIARKQVKHALYWMIWANFSAKGRGNLYFLPQNRTMIAQQYEDVLQGRLKEMMTVHSCTLCMHDGASCHQAKRIKTWLDNQNIGVLGPWPGQSPDLNPIENLWTVVKRKVSNMKPTSLLQLCDAILKVWCTEIDPVLCRKIVHSMPGRIDTVLKNKGHYCKY